MTTNVLNYYLGMAAKGDSKAAFEAARIMRSDEMSEVIVQTQLRRSASMGYAPAQTYLGILGICGILVKPESTVGHISYYNTVEPAIEWLKKAVAGNDPVAKHTFARCMQFGIGVPKDEDRAKAMLDESLSEMSEQTVLDLLLMFDWAKESKTSIIAVDLRALLLAS